MELFILSAFLGCPSLYTNFYNLCAAHPGLGDFTFLTCVFWIVWESINIFFGIDQ